MLEGVDDLRRHGILQLLLDQPPQVPRAVGQGIGLLRQIVHQRVVVPELIAFLAQRRLQLLQHDPRDAAEILLRQVVKAHDLVHTVQEFRPQEVLQCLHDALLPLVVGAAAEAHRAGCLVV